MIDFHLPPGHCVVAPVPRFFRSTLRRMTSPVNPSLGSPGLSDGATTGAPMDPPLVKLA